VARSLRRGALAAVTPDSSRRHLMFADELDRIDRQMHARITPGGTIQLPEERSRWGADHVGMPARRIGTASDECPTCYASFLDHAQYIRHRGTCVRFLKGAREAA
jgi:hypothetical protein